MFIIISDRRNKFLLGFNFFMYDHYCIWLWSFMYDKDIKIYENPQSTNRLWNSALIFLICVYMMQFLYAYDAKIILTQCTSAFTVY